MIFISRMSLLSAVVGAFALLSASFAAADPQNEDSPGLVNTSCSVDQIQAAVQNEAPKFWEHISSDPDKVERFRDKVQEFLDKSPEDRQTAIDQFRAHAKEWAQEHPDKAKWGKQHKEQFRDTVKRVLDTCPQY